VTPPFAHPRLTRARVLLGGDLEHLTVSESQRGNPAPPNLHFAPVPTFFISRLNYAYLPGWLSPNILTATVLTGSLSPSDLGLAVPV
jgi:hypothetical protein